MLGRVFRLQLVLDVREGASQGTGSDLLLLLLPHPLVVEVFWSENFEAFPFAIRSTRLCSFLQQVQNLPFPLCQNLG